MRNALKELLFDAQDFLADGNIALAIKTYQTALAEAKKNTIEEYMVMTSLALAYDDAGSLAAAVVHFKKAQEIAENAFGKSSLEYATALGNEATMYLNQQAPSKSEPLFDVAVQISKDIKLRKSSKRDDPFRSAQVDINSNAADCKVKLGKISEAIELKQCAYVAAKATLAAIDPRRVDAGVQLGALLAFVGRGKEADAMQHEVMDSFDKSRVDPLQSMTTFMGAMDRAAAMLDELENQTAKPRQPATRGKKSEPKVVPLFADAGTIQKGKSICLAGYQLKITLKRVKPAIWRRVVVPADCPLLELHRFIQKAMGWHDFHLHEFRIFDARFGDPKMLSEAKDERKYRLAGFNLQVGSKFEYEYDFGDGWEHTVEVEEVLDAKEYEASVPFVCGKGGCPPEDCGGPHGFMHLLDSLKRSPANRKGMPEWLSEYDPEELPSVFADNNSRSPNRKKKSPATASNIKQLTLL